MDIVTEKWNEIIENVRLEHSLSDVSFKTWILPLKGRRYFFSSRPQRDGQELREPVSDRLALRR